MNPSPTEMQTNAQTDCKAIMAYVRQSPSRPGARGTPYGVVIATLDENGDIVIGWSRTNPRRNVLVPVGKVGKNVIYSYVTKGDVFDKEDGFAFALGRALDAESIFDETLPDDFNLRAKLGYIARTALRYFKGRAFKAGMQYDTLLNW